MLDALTIDSDHRAGDSMVTVNWHAGNLTTGLKFVLRMWCWLNDYPWCLVGATWCH